MGIQKDLILLYKLILKRLRRIWLCWNDMSLADLTCWLQSPGWPWRLPRRWSPFNWGRDRRGSRFRTARLTPGCL